MQQCKITFELAVTILVVTILTSVVAYEVFFAPGRSSNSRGVNTRTESRCIEGYKFVIAQDNAHQILDEFGKGVKCGDVK